MRATQMKQIIKTQQVQLKDKKQRDFEEKQARARGQIEEKMYREEQ
jgi:hypothetical protein